MGVDEPGGGAPPPPRSWGVSRRVPLILALLATLVAALAATSTPEGALLGSVAAAGLAAAAVFTDRTRPVLAVDPGGLTVLDGLRRRHYPWAEVSGVRAETRRRRAGVEILLGEHLVVLSPVLLGAPVSEVVAELRTWLGTPES